MHSLISVITNQAETWFSPSCGLADRQGDDPGGVVNPNLPVQPTGTTTGTGSGTGNEVTPAWKTVDCSNTGITNAAQDQTLRWNDVDTAEAWAAAVENWRANPYPAGLTFSEQVANFFNAPENMNCGDTESGNGCDPNVQCNEVNHPAGYFILNSLALISHVPNPESPFRSVKFLADTD